MKFRITLFVIFFLAVGACHRTPTAQPTPPKSVQFVIEGRSRLLYECNNFKSQIKSAADIITLRHRTVEAFRELLPDRDNNLALITSLRSALDTNDNLRLEELVVNYECGKLLVPKP